MEAYARQQFDVLLWHAAENLAERAVQRCAGQDAALRMLRTDPNGTGVWLDSYVDAVFAESCLDNPDGAAFVLCAVPKRQVSAVDGGAVADVLVRLAKRAFADLLAAKVIEALERASGYGVGS